MGLISRVSSRTYRTLFPRFLSSQNTMAMRRLLQATRNASSHTQTRTVTTLRERVQELIPAKQEEVKAFRAKHGNDKIGDINVNMLYGGMRGMKAMVWETSVLDPEEGIRFQGKTIPGHVSDMLDRFPAHLHPMAQFAAAINACNSES